MWIQPNRLHSTRIVPIFFQQIILLCRLFKASSAKLPEKGTKANKINQSSQFDNICNDHRRAKSFPSYSDESNSAQGTTFDTNQSEKWGLFQSLLDDADSSRGVEKSKKIHPSEIKGKKAESKIGYVKKCNSKNSIATKKVFSDSTLNYVVEKVEKLDIERPQKVRC